VVVDVLLWILSPLVMVPPKNCWAHELQVLKNIANAHGTCSKPAMNGRAMMAQLEWIAASKGQWCSRTMLEDMAGGCSAYYCETLLACEAIGTDLFRD